MSGDTYGNKSELDEEELINQPYYIENITTEDAEIFLRDVIKKEGAFIVRKRAKEDAATKPYAISVFYDGSMHHYRIKQYDNEKFSIDTQDKSPKMFNSVPELIRFFDERNACRCKLTTKFNQLIGKYKNELFKPANVEVETEDDEYLEYLPFYLGDTSQKDVTKYLKEFKQDELFYIRKTLTEKTPYEMCIYYKSCIYYLKITRTTYDAYSIENSEATFDTIVDLVKHFNYNELQLNKCFSVKLQFHSKYIKK